MVFMQCTTLFLTFAVFFNAVLVESYDTVPITGSRVCKMYNRGRLLRETLTFTWKGLKLSSGCRLDFRDSQHNLVCVDIDAKLSCSSAPLTVIQNIHLESIMHYLDCKIGTQRLCSKSRLIVIFKPSLYSNYKNHVTLKFYPADENGQEFQVVPLYPEFNNNDVDYTVEQTETIHDTAMSVTVTIGIIVALIVGGIIVVTLIICCCCCRGRRSQGHVYRSTPVTTTTTTVITQQRNQPPQYPAQAPGGYPGYQTTSPAPCAPAAQMAPPHQGTSPGYPPQNMAHGYPLQNQGSKLEPSAPPPPPAPYMQDMPYYPPPQDQSYPPPPNQPYPPQPYGGMVQPPPYSEK
ncbi:hypothetical protein KP79_PYT11664 [Mizuhopecten yessoensis]|uniref:Uncharacterized protein n=1 Tax=Mizuhopecten yessoensis TaxID=6573 RepID=A0A210R4P5_MIZYE|nr:hypothetical protein KP79_PYT11664 [Mizuhopecten yessoensis]